MSILFFTSLGVGLMFWLYSGFDFSPLGSIFSVRANYIWIVLTLFVGVAANVLRAFRWRMLLESSGISIGRRRSVELVFISYLINSVTPRLGELTRSLLVRRGSMSCSAKAFGTVVIEKMADVACLLLVVMFAVVLRWEDTKDLVDRSLIRLDEVFSSAVFYAVVASSMVLLLIIVWSKVKQLRLLLINLWSGVASIVRLRNPFGFVVLCVLIWVCNFLQLYLLVPCFSGLSGMDLGQSFYLFAAASVGVLLPTPGGAGPWHFAIVKTLTHVFAIDGQVAKLFALVTHGLKTALVMLLGILAYFTFYWEAWGRKKRK